jgi:hypothetical protein
VPLVITLWLSKHVGLSIQRVPHHLESVPEVHDLFSGNASSDEFGTICGHFHGLMTLGELFDRSLVDKMEDTSTGAFQ